jgi:PAS domain S-box-containing protein
MSLSRWRLRAAVSADRLSRAAAPLLIVRVLQGLIAWLFFNEYFSIAPVRRFWIVQGAFVAYLLLNLLFSLRYRRGQAPRGLLLADMAVNVLTLGVPIAASGGRISALLLLVPLQAVPYGLVFGGGALVAFLLGAGAMLAAVELADRAVLISVVPLATLAHGSVSDVVAFAFTELLIGAPLATLWLTWAMGPPPARPLMRLPERAERVATPAAVANALLTVSEAVSSLTRLDDILETVTEVAPRSIEMDYCGIALWTQESGKYVRAVAAGAHGDQTQTATGLQISPEQVPDFEWVRRLGHCVVVPVAESLQVAPVDVPAVLIAPLSSGEQFFGVMEFARRNPSRTFTQRDMTIADGIARQTAVAIERARLVEESRRLVRAVESTEEAVIITDPRRRILFANPAFMRTLGYRRDEVIGRDAFELAGHLPEPVEQFQDTLQRRSWRGETVVQRKDGTTIPILLNASLIRDTDGRVQGAVAILEDISEAKSFQEQMQRADRLAAVGELAAGIAHEINNALAAIFGQTKSDAARGEDELRNALERVDAQGRRIADIVQGVLGFARPRPPRPDPVDLAALTDKTLDLVRHDLSRHNIRLETAIDPNLPQAQADPQQIQQVLLNLFTNAAQAMAGRSNNWLRVEIRGEGDQVALRATDGGPGITAEVLLRIFDPFFSTKAEGSGLGLSVSYAIARAHGGDLRVDSEIGRGTTFTLLLPIAEPVAPATLESVLLVDDDDDVAEALSAMLVKEGLRVSRAATGAEGIAMLESNRWDAVFLDVRLPDLSGPEIYRRLEATHPVLAQRVVFVTGGVWRSESRLRQELPPQPILAKPCTQDEVRDVLRQLRTHRRQAA